MGNLLIIGAGQYGHLVKEMAELSGKFSKIDFIDDYSDLAIGKVSDLDRLRNDYSCAIVAIGNGLLRKKLIYELEQKTYEIVSLIHPTAYISPSAQIGKGCVIEPFCAVQCESIVQDSVFISTGSVINHNSIVESYCHLDVGSVIMSNQHLREGIKLSAGSIYGKEGN